MFIVAHLLYVGLLLFIVMISDIVAPLPYAFMLWKVGLCCFWLVLSMFVTSSYLSC
ncbi:hypothetical protein V1520DRAFT_214193 [Lipomyces starkeyi]